MRKTTAVITLSRADAVVENGTAFVSGNGVRFYVVATIGPGDLLCDSAPGAWRRLGWAVRRAWRRLTRRLP